MNCFRFVLAGLVLLLAACATGTIAQLKGEKVDLEDVQIEGGLDKAIQNYQIYLDKTPESDLTPESMLRLADLKFKKEYDIVESSTVAAGTGKPLQAGQSAIEAAGDFEKRTTAGREAKSAPAIRAKPAGAGTDLQSAGTREAITLYKKLLSEYPKYELNDHALYQLARIYEEQGNVEEAMKMMDQLAKDYPHSRYIEEVQFRRGEYNYANRKFADAKGAYKALVDIGAGSSYYELALYKLGWTHYKQDQYEEAMRQFVTLLDHKIATGNDLDHPVDSFDEKRIEDTFRVMSLTFSNLGGADAVAGYFSKYGKRSYESNAYKNLGDDYLEKRRYSDAAATYKAFVKSNPNHRMSPYFDKWAIDSYKKGGFPKLVIEANKEFVASYGLKSAYWTRQHISAFNDVAENVKTCLKELANYYHAQYQDKRFVKNRDENFVEASKWYREFLNSYPKDESAPAIHFQLAALLLENKWYGDAAAEYERVAYDYPSHDKSAAAGYAAIYAHRQSLAASLKDEKDRVRREVIRSSLKFAEAFPRHEKAALVLNAAIDDIYEMKNHALAAETARKMLARYPGTERPIRRAVWLIFAHSSFELGNFKDAEEGYISVLGMTAENDASRAGLNENLAASFYKQGEQANKLGDFKKAATYFLLVGSYAPSSKIRPIADYDGATALINLKDWNAAAGAVNSFRTNYPGHKLQTELTRKLAFAYKEAGELSLAAAEYELVASESQDDAVRRDALGLAGELYFQANQMDKAYPVYRRYLNNYPKPLEYALELRNRIAMHLKAQSDMEYLRELNEILEADARAGSERTSRTRYLGAAASMELAGLMVKQFTEIKLVKPIEKNLIKKKEAMKAAKEQLEKLFDYEMDEATSAGTFYLADIYYNFSRILVESERPDDLNALEREQYELSIEEQAYPFEEKAIEVHKKNLELMARGIFNTWIEKSIEKLAKLVPAKYAKFEESSGFIEAVDAVNYAAIADPKPVSSKSSPVPVANPPAAGTAQKIANDPNQPKPAAVVK